MAKFFGKLVDAAQNAASKATAIGDNLWQLYGPAVSGQAISVFAEVTSLGKSFIVQDDKFKTQVNDRLWAMVPLPVRLVGRKRLHWDEMLFGLRDNVFVVEGETVHLRTDAKDEIMMRIKSKLDCTYGPSVSSEQDPT